MEDLRLEAREVTNKSATAMIIIIVAMGLFFIQLPVILDLINHVNIFVTMTCLVLVLMLIKKIINSFTGGIYASLEVRNNILTLTEVTMMLKEVTTSYKLDELVKIKKSNPYSFNQGLSLTFKNKKRVYIQFYLRGRYGYMSRFKFLNDKHPLYLEVLKCNDYDMNGVRLGGHTDAYYDYFKSFIKE